MVEKERGFHRETEDEIMTATIDLFEWISGQIEQTAQFCVAMKRE